RDLVRSTIATDDLTLVYVKASFETCARRDPKGLYAKVAAGEVKQFTGKDAGFDEPTDDEPTLVLDTETLSVTECVDVLAKALPKAPA
ncbi:MAG TPA: adenylyl-sulfate kinase, partial [Candidatus Synoicihabitans sp.]|nr:adenylyl-sulfate kinase [Candidatus Synoicihabitans sp.]